MFRLKQYHSTNTNTNVDSSTLTQKLARKQGWMTEGTNTAWFSLLCFVFVFALLFSPISQEARLSNSPQPVVCPVAKISASLQLGRTRVAHERQGATLIPALLATTTRTKEAPSNIHSPTHAQTKLGPTSLLRGGRVGLVFVRVGRRRPIATARSSSLLSPFRDREQHLRERPRW